MENLTINDDPINTTTGFDALPQDVVVNIFSYHKSNYLELTAIGKTCSNFRKTINDKENDSILWDSKQRLPPNFFIEGLETEKQITRRLYMLDKIRLEQRSDKGTESIFLVELGIVKLKELFNEILQSRYLEGAVQHGIPNHLDNDFIPLDSYDFTDMAVYGLVELVQANIIEYLEQEVRFILSGDERNRHCRVLRYFGWGTGTSMVGTDNHQSANWQPSFGTFDTRRLPQLTWDGSMTNNTINIERNKIVRRLGYRAGIPEILGINNNNNTTTKLSYKSVWRSICNIILEILSPVCVHKDAQRHHQVPGFTPIISFGDIEFHINNRNASTNNLCLPYKKVYCGLESFIEDSDSETDVEMEMNEYYCDSDDDDDDDDSNNNIDHNTTEMDVDNNNNEDSDDDGSYYTADGNITSS